MDKPQEQKIIRALHMLGGIIIASARAVESQNTELTQTWFDNAEGYHQELLKLIHPELQFENSPQIVKPTIEPQQHERHDQGDHPRLPHV